MDNVQNCDSYINTCTIPTSQTYIYIRYRVLELLQNTEHQRSYRNIRS
jgi:hypothetical protein